MSNFRIHCHVEGYFEIEAESEDEAMEKGNELIEGLIAHSLDEQGREVKFHDAQSEAYEVEEFDSEE